MCSHTRPDQLYHFGKNLIFMSVFYPKPRILQSSSVAFIYNHHADNLLHHFPIVALRKTSHRMSHYLSTRRIIQNIRSRNSRQYVWKTFEKLIFLQEIQNAKNLSGSSKQIWVPHNEISCNIFLLFAKSKIFRNKIISKRITNWKHDKVKKSWMNIWRWRIRFAMFARCHHIEMKNGLTLDWDIWKKILSQGKACFLWSRIVVFAENVTFDSEILSPDCNN